MAQYKITAEPNPAEHAITLLLNGKFSEESLPELDDFLNRARSLEPTVLLDLSEVTLVDRKAAEYFSRSSENVQLINCPVYLRQWIRNGK